MNAFANDTATFTIKCTKHEAGAKPASFDRVGLGHALRSHKLMEECGYRDVRIVRKGTKQTVYANGNFQNLIATA